MSGCHVQQRTSLSLQDTDILEVEKHGEMLAHVYFELDMYIIAICLSLD